MQSVTQKLGMLNRGYGEAKHYIKTLLKYDLLEPLSIDVSLGDGSKNRLIGFHTIHEEKLLNLETAALEEFQKDGWLMPTYMALASLSNLTALVNRKNDLTVQKQE